MGTKNKEAPRTFYRCGDSFGRAVTDHSCPTSVGPAHLGRSGADTFGALDDLG